MNFIAHILVALSTTNGSDDDGGAGLAFGAALPDLASMAGVRLDPSSLPDPVRRGVALHHRTDAIFHSLGEFRTGVAQLREQLKTAGLAVGPSRAVGHAGWELLLDGCLLDRPGTEEDVSTVLAGAPDVAESVSPADPGRWRGLIDGMRSERWWLAYSDTDVVAHRLERRLRHRRRLCFKLDDIALVTSALAVAKPQVDRAADGVMVAVVAEASRGRPLS